MRVTAIDEAAVANRTASGSDRPSERATASAPLKVSPGPRRVDRRDTAAPATTLAELRPS